MRFLDAQEKLGIVIENQRDLSWEYLGKDKKFDAEMYPPYEEKEEQTSAEAMAYLLGGEAFISEHFTNTGGTLGGVWFVKFPSGLMVRASNLGLLWNKNIGHYQRLIANWNMKGRDGRAAGTDPEQQNPVITTTVKLAEEYYG